MISKKPVRKGLMNNFKLPEIEVTEEKSLMRLLEFFKIKKKASGKFKFEEIIGLRNKNSM